MLVKHLKQINFSNKTIKYLTEKEMLDISIENADKLKNKADFLNDTYKVSEKFDGTKLTLWRNDNEWNEDYQENWIIAFKNQILYSAEFKHTNRNNAKKYSVGVSQYALVHDHIKAIHNKTKSFPKNTEIFIEFIQNKLTTTRDYENKHGLYIIAYSPAKGSVSGGMLKTKPSGFFQDKIDEYSQILELNLPPVVFEGSLNSINNITKGIKNDKLLKAWNEFKSEYDANPYETVKKTFLEFESELGGRTEGVVLNSADGKIFKFVQSDQYDKDNRFVKKDKYLADKDTEVKYWETINSLSNQILKELNYDIDNLSYEDILEKFTEKVNDLSPAEIEKIFDFKFEAMKSLNKI